MLYVIRRKRKKLFIVPAMSNPSSVPVPVPTDTNEAGPTRENTDADDAAESSDENKPDSSRWKHRTAPHCVVKM